MSRTTVSTYSDSGRETPQRDDFVNTDLILGAGDYTENVQRPDREKGDVLSDQEATSTLDSEVEYLEDTGVPVYLVPGNQDGFGEEYIQEALNDSEIGLLAYDSQPVGEDLVVVAGGVYAHPEIPVYKDQFQREIGIPATSTVDASDYETAEALMNGIIEDEEELLQGSVEETLQDDNLADLVSDEARQIVGRQANLEAEVQTINRVIDSVDSGKNILFAHHGAANGADLDHYDLDLIENPGTFVDGKNYGSVAARSVLEQNAGKIDAAVFGHFEGQAGQSEIEGVPVFNVSKNWTDLTFDPEDGLINAEQRGIL